MGKGWVVHRPTTVEEEQGYIKSTYSDIESRSNFLPWGGYSVIIYLSLHNPSDSGSNLHTVALPDTEKGSKQPHWMNKTTRLPLVVRKPTTWLLSGTVLVNKDSDPIRTGYLVEHTQVCGWEKRKQGCNSYRRPAAWGLQKKCSHLQCPGGSPASAINWVFS